MSECAVPREDSMRKRWVLGGWVVTAVVVPVGWATMFGANIAQAVAVALCIINSDLAPCATNLIQPTSGSGETGDLLNGAHGSYKDTNRQTTTMPIYNIRCRVLPIVFPAFAA